MPHQKLLSSLLLAASLSLGAACAKSAPPVASPAPLPANTAPAGGDPAAKPAATGDAKARPSKDDCDKAMHHAMDVMMAEMPPEQKKQMDAAMNSEQGKQQIAQELERCTKEMTAGDVQCVLAAKDMKTLQTCDNDADGDHDAK